MKVVARKSTQSYKKYYCKHEKYKYICKDSECRETATRICEHKKQKQFCNDPKCNGGKSLCDHGHQRNTCKDSGCRETANGICSHGNQKSYCKHPDCLKTASRICSHGTQKARCKHPDCIKKSTGICKHEKNKQYCNDPTCDGGSALCKIPSCDKNSRKKYRGHCMTCFMSLFPAETVFRNYKTKEGAVLCHIRQCFPDLIIPNDRRIDGGCSGKKPDFFIELLTHVVIIEVDENAHMTYDQSCENKRMMELSEDIAHRPMVFIRFNPDGNSDGPSCWGVDGNGLAIVKKKRAVEWQKRLAALTAKINFWKVTIPDKTVELIKLFY